MKIDHYQIQSATVNPKDSGYKITGLKKSQGKDFKKGQSGKKGRQGSYNSGGPKKKHKTNYH